MSISNLSKKVFDRIFEFPIKLFPTVQIFEFELPVWKAAYILCTKPTFYPSVSDIYDAVVWE